MILAETTNIALLEEIGGKEFCCYGFRNPASTGHVLTDSKFYFGQNTALLFTTTVVLSFKPKYLFLTDPITQEKRNTKERVLKVTGSIDTAGPSARLCCSTWLGIAGMGIYDKE
ncbi:hypothetical protein HAX54_025198 [Datura stramonium]|uniref:Uncharacterized protein n=1 Tax=Datura stramonium TaxID=4076 RepID=A0ABS8S7G9_DATST|nr:hypothetical protein [Datura stramonium]